MSSGQHPPAHLSFWKGRSHPPDDSSPPLPAETPCEGIPVGEGQGGAQGAQNVSPTEDAQEVLPAALFSKGENSEQAPCQCDRGIVK